ncbi:MAG: PorT family protein [Microscillaceae bacterium]|jgi:opacity protein-like surface antigen|nr:PorT family protein [Microscillaceae bacterium]
MYYIDEANQSALATNFYENVNLTPPKNEMKVNIRQLNVPLLLHYSFLNNKLNVFAGVTLQFLLSSRREFQSMAVAFRGNSLTYLPAFDDKNTKNNGFNTFIPAIDGGIQYQISPKFKVELSYRHNLKNIYKPLQTAIVDQKDYQSKISSLQIGLNYTIFQQ